MLATNATAPPVLLGAGALLEPVGAPPLPPTEGLLEVVDAPVLVLVPDRVALLIVVLRATLAPVPDALAPVPATTVVVALAEAVAMTVEFGDAEDLPAILPPPMTPPEPLVVVADADADAAVDEAEADEVEPPVRVIMPV